MKGYAGQILRVNLSTGDISKEKPDELLYRRYFGGTGFIAYHLLKELPKGVDPLGPENKLIFALGAITGNPIPGAGRSSVGAKSPLNGGIGFSEAGGFWGAELKRAGFDAIIIEGKASKPSYLWIHDGEVEIRDGSHLWGKTTGEVESTLKEELGDQRVRVTQIGPAGENMVRYACILNDLSHAYGRTGMGAVMGSKNLRAIATRGTKAPEMADPAKVRELVRWFTVDNKNAWANMNQYGTAGGVPSLQASSALPTKNFIFGQFDGYDKISGQAMAETILEGRGNCYACPVFCKRVVKTGEPYNVDPQYGGPEYETLGAFGSVCGVDDLAAISKANEICNAYGLDTISAGVTIGFAMECYERGILKKEDLDGIEAPFGDASAMLTLLEKIYKREGVGDLLAEGSKRAAEKIGHDSIDFAIQVKGQEVPMHEPRAKMGLGVGYAVSPTGADHMHNVHDTGYAVNSSQLDAYGNLGGPIPTDDLGDRKVRLLVTGITQAHFDNCAGKCNFIGWGDDNNVSLIRAVTGWNSNLMELYYIGERALTLARIFNLREGLSEKDDVIPKRFYDAFKDGPLEGVAPTHEEMDNAIRNYYEMMGWDKETGVPGRGKLKLLDIEWAAEELQ